MSRKYKHGDHVPTAVLVARLEELAKAFAAGGEERDREFTMRIPAELDRDPDLVMSEAAKRLALAEELAKSLKEIGVCYPGFKLIPIDKWDNVLRCAIAFEQSGEGRG